MTGSGLGYISRDLETNKKEIIVSVAGRYIALQVLYLSQTFYTLLLQNAVGMRKVFLYGFTCLTNDNTPYP